MRDAGPLLAAAADGTRERLLAQSRPLVLPRGAAVFAQDAPADHLHVLLEGSVGLSTMEDGGAATLVEILDPGDAFVVGAAMLRLPCPVSAATLAPSRIVMIPAELVRAEAVADAGLMQAALEQMARQWRLLVDQVVDLKTRDATQRVARFLARRLPSPQGAAELPEPRAAIAARLGMTPESLSRTLHGLEAAGLLRLDGRRVDVPDRAALLRLALPRSDHRARPA
ncbi:Crp/Fnr family transcriptional regulator [Roseomonas sp. CECT 9278]|uniref:Crp/Fnr family transcriptional regulator n=1 Tax=Roseomonas sp. CECT 9278 TaxID=2845823 RepID=UPI001E3862C3|nr:helix-turn-helix domain-containing protein [Roseomonas sp. CECT 9278]